MDSFTLTPPAHRPSCSAPPPPPNTGEPNYPPSQAQPSRTTQHTAERGTNPYGQGEEGAVNRTSAGGEYSSTTGESGIGYKNDNNDNMASSPTTATTTDQQPHRERRGSFKDKIRGAGEKIMGVFNKGDDHGGHQHQQKHSKNVGEGDVKFAGRTGEAGQPGGVGVGDHGGRMAQANEDLNRE